jgi:hypothetical protein
VPGRHRIAPNHPMKPSVETQRALKQLFVRALQIRVGLAVILHFMTGDSAFAPDQSTYHAWSEHLAQYWSGEVPFYPGRLLLPGEPVGYYRIVAALYFVFGAWALLPKLLNAVVGATTVRLVFDLTWRITGNEPMGLRAAKYTAYFPSLVLWSVLNIRDCWVVLFIILVTRQSLALQDQPSLRNALLLVAGIYAITVFRSYILFAVTAPILVSFVVRQRGHIMRNAVLGMLAAGALIYVDAAAGRERRMRMPDLEEMNRSRKWSASAAESGFAADVDISTPDKALAFLPVGLAYFMLAPFPWTVANFRQGLALPEMLYFYFLLPFLIRGILHLLRHHLSSSLMIVLIAVGITLGYAIGQGNVGTIYRHRAQVLPLFLIFAAVGVEANRGRRPARLPAPGAAPPVARAS